MSRTTTPRYIFTISAVPPSAIGFYVSSPMVWRREYGRPTTTNLEQWVKGHEISCQPGKPNAHLGREVVMSAEIRDQFSGDIVATWRITTAAKRTAAKPAATKRTATKPRLPSRQQVATMP